MLLTHLTTLLALAALTAAQGAGSPGNAPYLSRTADPTTSTPAPKPKPRSKPVDPDGDATPGDVRFCTSTTYKSGAGDDPNGACDVVNSDPGHCRNLSAQFRSKVMSVRPDKGQLCLFHAKADCYGDAESIRWPGVDDLRGRLGRGGVWANKIVSFSCSKD